MVYVAARAGRRIRVCAARNADIKTENRKNQNERKSESGRIKNFNESTPDMPGKSSIPDIASPFDPIFSSGTGSAPAGRFFYNRDPAESKIRRFYSDEN